MEKEKPIIFSTEMVRQILAGQKTQTRRIMKPQPILAREQFATKDVFTWANKKFPKQWFDENNFKNVIADFAPYGGVGSKLWVRETWRESRFHYQPKYLYKETDDNAFETWKPSIHMPREASRITLEITDIRVERLDEISFDDCFAEGITEAEVGIGSPKNVFRNLWTKINGADSWNQNNWVWVISFKRV